MISLVNGVLPLTPQNLDLLNQINSYVNQNTFYKTDMQLYNRPDFWTIAEGQGDCEDYALAKRHKLRAAGVPREVVRICTAWVESPVGVPGGGEYHAVLSIDTDGGTLVLDNRYPDLHYWEDMPYKWHMREVPGKFFWEQIA